MKTPTQYGSDNEETSFIRRIAAPDRAHGKRKQKKRMAVVGATVGLIAASAVVGYAAMREGTVNEVTLPTENLKAAAQQYKAPAEETAYPTVSQLDTNGDKVVSQNEYLYWLQGLVQRDIAKVQAANIPQETKDKLIAKLQENYEADGSCALKAFKRIRLQKITLNSKNIHTLYYTLDEFCQTDPIVVTQEFLDQYTPAPTTLPPTEAPTTQPPTEPPTYAPTYPAPTQPEPTYPAPTQPEPTYPAPTQPEPTYPVPTEPEPTYPVPTEPEPTYPVPTEPEPTYPVPTEPEPTYPVPTEPEPTYPVPTEPEPTYPVPTEPEPTYPVPTEPTPTEPMPYPTKEPEPWEPTEPTVEPTGRPNPTEPTPYPTEPVPTEPYPTQPVPTEPLPTQPNDNGEDIKKIIEKLGGYDEDEDKKTEDKQYMTKDQFHQKLVDHFDKENKYLEDVIAKAEAEYNALSTKIKRLDDCIEQAANKFGWYGVYEQAPHFANAVDWVANVCMKQD